MVPEGGSDANPAAHDGGGGTVGTGKFELHVPNGPEPRLRHWLCPGIGVGSLDVKLSVVPEGGSEVPIPPQHMVVVAEQVER
jgi:hypothetical protein